MTKKAKRNGVRGKNMAENVSKKDDNTDKQGYRRFRDITDEELITAFHQSNSLPSLKKRLGLNPKYEHNDYIRARCSKNNLEYQQLIIGRLLEQYTEDELRVFAETYSNYAEIAAVTDHTIQQVSKTFKQIGLSRNKATNNHRKEEMNNPHDVDSQLDGYIYKITNLVNGKCYIGQTINKPEHRWSEHVRTSHYEKGDSYDYPLYQSLRKHGINSFSFEILEQCKRSIINERESYYIELFDSFENGYNQTLGGVGFRNIPPAEEQEIIASFRNGMTIASLAVSFHRTHTTIRSVLRRGGVTEKELTEHARNAIVHKVEQYDANYNLIRTFDSLSCVGEWIIAAGLSRCKNKTAAATQIKIRLAKSLTDYCEYAGYIWKSDFTREELDDFLARNNQYKENNAARYAYKNNKAQYYDECPRCHGEKLIESEFCSNCRKQLRTQDFSKIPIGREALKTLIRTTSFAQIGRTFGVTDNSVRKWCKRFELPARRRDIESMSDKEWKNI